MNVNAEKTRNYYASIDTSVLCDCNYCRNYRAKVRTVYPDVAVYLDALGIDIEKPLETSPLEPDENGVLEYCCCQYVVMGTCSADYQHRIHEVELRKGKSYPTTGVEGEHFVLDLYPIRLAFSDGSGETP